MNTYVQSYDYTITLIKQEREREKSLSPKKDALCQVVSMYFHYFVIISPWKSDWTNLNPLYYAYNQSNKNRNGI